MNINEELKNILEWVICIIIAVVLGLWIRYYIMTPTQVQSVSMKPTLIEGQRLILNRTIRLTHKLPERGDIITFEAPTEDYLTEAEFKESPTARYEEPENKFVHNVLEIGKVSYIKRDRMEEFYENKMRKSGVNLLSIYVGRLLRKKMQSCFNLVKL